MRIVRGKSNGGDFIGRVIDLTGQKFGRLTVVERAENYISPKGQPQTQWRCRCDCGNETIVLGCNLKKKSVMSCGCLSKEKSSRQGKLAKRYNTYDLTGEYGIGYTLSGEPFYFDLEDYDKIKDYCWYRTNYDYVIAKIPNGNDSHIKLHNLLFPDAQKVDHIKHINYDNRKSQLRPVTSSQNMMNRKINKNNKSGYKGVHWDKNKNKWIAFISIDRKTYSKGFKAFEDAVKQRKEWEEKYFGEYSYDNSMKGAI